MNRIAQDIEDLSVTTEQLTIAQAIDVMGGEIGAEVAERIQAISPADGATGVDGTGVIFDWSDSESASVYRLYASYNSDMSNPFINGLVVVGTSYTDPNVQNSQTVYWYPQPQNVVDRPAIVPEDAGFEADDSINGDLTALNDLYEQSGGPDGFWDNTTGWPIPDTASMGDAYGIEVWTQSDIDAHNLADGSWLGRVRKLDLNDNGLRNIVLDENASEARKPVITNLEGDVIQVFDIAGNNSGNNAFGGLANNDFEQFRCQERYLEISGKNLKQSIGNLKKCQEFNILHNLLGGLLPDSIWKLTYCERMGLGFDKDIYNLGGSGSQANPPWSGFSYPQKWTSWMNKFRGSISQTIGQNMPHLKSLYCARNYFDNTIIPESIWDIPGLEHLVISHNGFIGNLPTKRAAFENVIEELHTYGGTAHSNRNAGNMPSQPNILKLSGEWVPNIGYFSEMKTLRIAGLNDFSGSCPPEWANLNLQTIETIFDGVFPTFFNNDNMLGLTSAFITTPEGPPGGLPSDYNVVKHSGKIDYSFTPLGGTIPDSWSDSNHPNFPADDGLNAGDGSVQIWDLRTCGISGNFATDISKLTNTKIFRLQGNNFTNELFTDYPNNNRMTEFKIGNNSMWGTFRASIRKMTGERFWMLDFEANEISNYEKGALGALEFDGNGNYVSGLRGRFINARETLEIYLQENQLSVQNLDDILVDVSENIQSRQGTPWELQQGKLVLDLSNQKTGATPSNTSIVQDAISFLESYGILKIENINEDLDQPE